MEENKTVLTKRKPIVLSEQTSTTEEPSTQTGETEQQDEQMEKFYALLENIRAMRGAWGGGRGGASRKKMKVDDRTEPEAPWRPTFKLEDFMQGGDNDAGRKLVKNEVNGAEKSDES